MTYHIQRSTAARLIALAFLCLTIGLSCWTATGAETPALGGNTAAQIGQTVWLDVQGEPAFDTAKSVQENLELFRTWIGSTKFLASAPADSKPVLEPDVQIKFAFTAAALNWDLRVKFVPDAAGVYVVVASVDKALLLHRVEVGGQAPPPIQPPVQPNDPNKPPPVQPNNPNKVTSVVLVFEKDTHLPPGPVSLALQRLNASGSGIAATEFEDDSTDGDGDVPDQYKVALEAARKAGLPALVVLSGEKVLRVVVNPQTFEQVMEAVR